ncbi:hypothetical protein Hanom_Chr06g00531731 [Helianthus anomalus]
MSVASLICLFERLPPPFRIFLTVGNSFRVYLVQKSDIRLIQYFRAKVTCTHKNIPIGHNCGNCY